MKPGQGQKVGHPGGAKRLFGFPWKEPSRS